MLKSPFRHPCCARIASARSTGALQIVRWRGIGADTPDPQQALARLAYPSYLAPPAQRDHRTHAIARKERDATAKQAKQQQKRFIHISPPSLSTRGKGGVSICASLVTTGGRSMVRRNKSRPSWRSGPRLSQDYAPRKQRGRGPCRLAAEAALICVKQTAPHRLSVRTSGRCRSSRRCAAASCSCATCRRRC